MYCLWLVSYKLSKRLNLWKLEASGKRFDGSMGAGENEYYVRGVWEPGSILRDSGSTSKVCKDEEECISGRRSDYALFSESTE